MIAQQTTERRAPSVNSGGSFTNFHCGERADFRELASRMKAEGRAAEAVDYLCDVIEVLSNISSKDEHPIDYLDIHLTDKERRILIALHDAQGQIVTQSDVLGAMYFDALDGGGDRNILGVYMCKLRKKLPENWRIKTLYNRGYRLVVGEVSQ